jgi:LmbE family N-acetylglucosaminyl deacetylase/glycosyltransferase involved in cell wall biosynthesis
MPHNSRSEIDFIPYQSEKILPSGNTLVVAPHPDDEVFGCGGAIVRHVAQGDALLVVIATDGGFPVSDHQNTNEYATIRKTETLSAADILGYGQPVFLRYPDRSLTADEGLIGTLLDIITNFHPANIYLPAASEIHPDHRALHKAGTEAAIRYDQDVNLVYYEVGQPLHPNFLHDITDIHPLLDLAMDCFVSQQAVQDYKRHINALHTYRTYTLNREVHYAEAFKMVRSNRLKAGDTLWQQQTKWATKVGVTPGPVSRYPLISVIVRTINRPELPEALQSLAQQTYPNIEVIVVDALGEKELMLGVRCGRFPLRVVSKARALDRPSAANAGLEAVRGDYFCFLDDDDLMLPTNIEHLYRVLWPSSAPAAYCIVEMVNQHAEPQIIYDREYDFEQLLLGNFIPNLALLFKSNIIQQHCKFDTAFPLFEDWDFLLQVAQLGDFIFVKTKGGIYRNLQESGVYDQSDVSFHYRRKLFEKWIARIPDHLFDSVIIQRGNSSYHTTVQTAQLFFRTDTNEFSEHHSVSVNVTAQFTEISFLLHSVAKVTQLRFDPLNDCTHIVLHGIYLLRDGQKIDIPLQLSSNALLENGSEYFFDTNDPQIFIHFDAFTPIQIEEVRIQLDYLTGGLQAALDLLKQKTTIFSEHQQALQHKQGEALATNPSV